MVVRQESAVPLSGPIMFVRHKSAKINARDTHYKYYDDSVAPSVGTYVPHVGDIL